MANRIKIPNLKKQFDAEEYTDLKHLLTRSCEKYSDDAAFILKHKKGREVSYENVTYKNYYKMVKSFANGLVDAGFGGKRLAIIGNNSMEWTIGYFGQLCGNGVVIPLDKGLPYEELTSSLNRSYADVLLFDKAHLALIEQIKESGECDNLEYICMNEVEGYLTLGALIEKGEKTEIDHFDEYVVDPDAANIILFTSGTTSLAKAVQLSHRNIVSNVYAMNISEDIRRGDVSMAFLPYHHTFGIMAQIVMMSAGATMTYCEGLKYVQKNIVEYKLTVFVCVPMLIESIYKKIMATIKKEGLEKKVKFGVALSRFLLKFGIDVRRKLFKDIHEQLGGNLRFVISGASAIDPEALKGLSDFGIFAFQGYGMTETSPVLAAENHVESRAGSIGKAILGVELCVDEPNEEGIGELIARGPNVMKGYFENQEATDEILIDGWLHTGDLARVDEDGFVYICGRKKNVIVLKNGKNVYPEELETLIANLPYVEENMVYGEPKKHDGDETDLALVAKIVYRPEAMQELYGLTDPGEIEQKIKTDIDVINTQVPVYKQLLRIHVTDEPMVKTTTGKVKRYANK
ncbi:MAG: AMP-dependent synthetase/ligase [Emergencia sp.]